MLTLIGWNDNLANFPTLNTGFWSWNVCWPQHNLRMSCRFVLDLLELLSGEVWWTVPWKGSCWCEIQRNFCRLTLIWSCILVGGLIRKKHCHDINDDFVFSSCWHSLKFHSNKVGKDHVRIVGIGFGISMEGIASPIKGLPVCRSFDCMPFWLRLFWNINYSNLAHFRLQESYSTMICIKWWPRIWTWTNSIWIVSHKSKKLIRTERSRTVE